MVVNDLKRYFTYESAIVILNNVKKYFNMMYPPYFLRMDFYLALKEEEKKSLLFKKKFPNIIIYVLCFSYKA